MGDIHAGTKHCAEDKIRRKITEIKDDPWALWIGMGDYGEFIAQSDPRFDIGVISDWVKKDDIVESQRKWIVNLFKPITDKCIGLLEGNHEDTCRTHHRGDPQQHICDDLGVKNLGYSCFVRLLLSRIRRGNDTLTIMGHFEHGSGWAITKGTKLNKLHRSMLSFDADIYGMGHMHDIITDSFPYLALAANNEIKQKAKVGAVTGCWFCTYTQGVRASYGEKRGYPPTALGCPIFTIKPQTGDITVSE